jgi:hypothetical protein
MSPLIQVSCVAVILALAAVGIGAMMRNRTLYLPAQADNAQPVNQEAERKRTEKIRAQSQLRVWGYCALLFVLIACGILAMPSVKKVSAALGATSTPTVTNTPTITPTPTITRTPTITPTRLTSTPGTPGAFGATAIRGSPTVGAQSAVQTVVVQVNQTVIVEQTRIVKVPVTVIVVVTATFTHTATPTGTVQSEPPTMTPTLTPTQTPSPTMEETYP